MASKLLKLRLLFGLLDRLAMTQVRIHIRLECKRSGWKCLSELGKSTKKLLRHHSMHRQLRTTSQSLSADHWDKVQVLKDKWKHLNGSKKVPEISRAGVPLMTQKEQDQFKAAKMPKSQKALWRYCNLIKIQTLLIHYFKVDIVDQRTLCLWTSHLWSLWIACHMSAKIFLFRCSPGWTWDKMHLLLGNPEQPQNPWKARTRCTHEIQQPFQKYHLQRSRSKWTHRPTGLTKDTTGKT